MALENVIIGAFVFLLILSFFMFSKQWKGLLIIFGGLFSSLVQDTAKTPEGARAIFNKGIEEAQTSYNKAKDILKNRAGELNILNDDLKNIQYEISEIEKKCEKLVKSGHIDEANALAEDREEKMIDLQMIKEKIRRVEPVVAEAEKTCKLRQEQLKTLKANSKNYIASIEMDKETEDMYDDLDELRKETTTDKLLEAVENEYIERRQKAIGAKVVYENRVETKRQKAIETANKLTSNSYIEELQKKYKN